MIKSEIIIYEKLEKNYSHLLAWAREDSFPIRNIDQEKIKLLRDIIAILIVFEGGHGKNVVFEHNLSFIDKIYMHYYSFTENFLSYFKPPSYLLITENLLSPKNRIRSYRGIVPKEIKDQLQYLEVEVPIDNINTIFVAIIKLNERNCRELINNFFNTTTSCILNSTNDSLFSHEFLMRFPIKYMNHSGTSTINFLNLILDYCNEKVNILRVGGDGGDQELSLQIFCTNDKKDLICLQAEAAFTLSNNSFNNQ
jgi:hypothetical protein